LENEISDRLPFKVSVGLPFSKLLGDHVILCRFEKRIGIEWEIIRTPFSHTEQFFMLRPPQHFFPARFCYYLLTPGNRLVNILWIETIQRTLRCRRLAHQRKFFKSLKVTLRF